MWTGYNMVWGRLRLINREAFYEKRKLFQTRLYKYLIFTTIFNVSSILIMSYFIGIFEFVVGVWIFLWHHNTIPGYLSSITIFFSRRISQSNCSFQLKLNYLHFSLNSLSIYIYLPCAEIGWPVNNISMATFLGTALPTATAGVEQNSPTFTLKYTKKIILTVSI